LETASWPVILAELPLGEGVMKPLHGKVAIVAGATRGAGWDIAKMLGEAGATVYCTGRSSRKIPNSSDHHSAGRPETIDETAELADAAGGVGIPVRTDHTVVNEVAALFKRVKREQRRLDVLVNVLDLVSFTQRLPASSAAPSPRWRVTLTYPAGPAES
jgi:NAD(P)-dependent dehydrogenase (short-subunit alcohol dehydrogenase family)